MSSHEDEAGRAPFSMTGGPVVAKGKVIIGTSLGINTGGGNYIVGLDVGNRQRSMAFQYHREARRARRR